MPKEIEALGAQGFKVLFTYMYIYIYIYIFYLSTDLSIYLYAFRCVCIYICIIYISLSLSLSLFGGEGGGRGLGIRRSWGWKKEEAGAKRRALMCEDLDKMLGRTQHGGLRGADVIIANSKARALI